jgi:trans-aconitate 2-methyltransferase
MAWNPDQYNRFADDREQPFWDLAGLVEAPSQPPALVDLGCGDGRLTAELHRRMEAARTVGIDSSAEMLERARDHAGAGVSFEAGDLAAWSGAANIVLANASLQWVPDHHGVLARWRSGLGPGGQLAVQVPANNTHASHVVARELAGEWMGEAAPPDPVEANVLAPEDYASVLYELGFHRQHVRMQVYAHVLESTASVVEWVKGTSLTRFRPVLPARRFDEFVDEYRTRLVARLGDHRPFLYTFRRILFWGRLPG